MALINGNEYDHIDFTKNGVTIRHPFKDTLSRQMSSDLVKVQDEEPTSEGTKIWIKPSGDSEVQVPTYEEFEALSDKIDDADATIISLAVGAQPTVSVTDVDGHKRFSFGIPASNGIASITKTATDGVIDTYTIAMTDGTSTSFSVNNSNITPESMAEAIATALQDYARIDGYYPDLTAGNADQLNSTKFVENTEPYLYRPSGGTSDIGNRKYLDAVVGVSLPWNQMVRDEASENQTDFADILTVTDAVEDSAALKVKIEPVQDLNGYDHPWPAGGGKNLFDIDNPLFTAANSTNLNQYSSKVEDGKLYNGGIIGSSSGTGVTIPAEEGQYTLSFVINGENGRYEIRAVNVGSDNIWQNSVALYTDQSSSGQTGKVSKTITFPAEYTHLLLCVYSATKYGSWETEIQIEKGSTATAYEPYSNICPITGWDGVKVTRTNENLWDSALYTLDNILSVEDDPEDIYYGFYKGSIRRWGDACNPIPIRIPDGNRLVVAADVGAHDTFTFRFYFRYSDGTYDYNGGNINAVVDEISHVARISTAGKTVVGYLITTNAGVSNYRGCIRNIQVYAVDTYEEMDYVEPQTNTYSITLPTEAGTVYGGELTVNEDGSGSLVVDKAKVTFDGTENWIKATNYNYYYVQHNDLAKIPDYTKSIICNRLPTVAYAEAKLVDYSITGYYYASYPGRNWFYIKITDDVSTTSDAKKWIAENNLDVVYPLAEPITYTLTASQITTLLGTNNIWSDAGQTALTYTGTDEHLTLTSGKKYLSRIDGTDTMVAGTGQTLEAAKGTDNVFDLTQMFGTSVADYVYNQGVSFFRKWFSKTWYPYNTGELKHVEGLQSHDVVGFNLWDEEREPGYWDVETGQKMPTTAGWIRSKNYIPVFPNTMYCFTATRPSSGSFGALICFDAEYRKLAVLSAVGGVFSTPNDAAYVAFYAMHQWFEKPICISLVHNGSRNGEYEPYEKHSYPLDSTVVLRGIPKVDANGVYWDGDRYLPDGTVERRYGVVDLGTLEWTYNISSFGVFSTSSALAGLASRNLVCIKYPTKSGNTMAGDITGTGGKWISANAGTGTTGSLASGVLIIKDNDYTDTTAFKAAMSGVLLIYELAEPTIEQAQPYRNFQLVDDWGTEEFVTTGMIPVGHESRYPANLRDKLQHLPDAASSNGSYLITQNDEQMTLTPFPAPPTTAGKYALRATVTNGVATFTWEATT